MKETARSAEKIILRCILVCVLVVMGDCERNLSFAQSPNPSTGTSLDNPAPVGASVVAKIVMGDHYVMIFETYEAKVSVLQIVRGAKAWDIIKQANASNGPPRAGFEYILARIRVEYHATGKPGDRGYDLWGSQFTAVSPEGRDYERPAAVAPNPELKTRLYSGDSFQGNIVFMVGQNDEKPLMTFGREYDSAIWFQLY
jgi:hypothetical protein